MIIAILTTVHVLICLFLIGVVLLQQGKGADLSVFGGGSTQAVFGARGAATILHKLTVAGFIGFIVTTITIGFLSTGASARSVMSGAGETAPAESVETPGDDGGAADAPAELEAASPEAGPVEEGAEPPAADDDGGDGSQ
ncbi:MAG: preprotein translocase subunit SecG [Thermoanaerobaculia bacterium]|nr:preprotein translocase subunit SecG [Thermoanaerobaculia bacterium]